MTEPASKQSILDNLLIEAVRNRDLARAKIYVSKGANVNLSLRTNQTLRRAGSTYSSQGTAPLYHDMLENNFSYEMSDFLLSQGVSVDVKNFHGNTPLMLAVKNGYLSHVKYFLGKGADPLATNEQGDVVLEEARKLFADYCSDRQNIIDTLVQALETPAKPQPAPEPVRPLNGAETQRDIQAMKPLGLAPRKKTGGGFNL